MRHGRLLYDWPEFIRRGIWVKQNPVPQMTGDRPGQGHEEIAILHAGKRRKRWNRRGGPGTWITPVCNKASVPTEKPLALLRALVTDFTAPGEIVLDPFAGSGTTGAACLEQGRGFIGIERDPERFAIAVKRLRAAAKQGGRP
nr:site-specific DNA-methyltransferase [Pseudoxanthomonas wuyuanensis]